ncbi:O105 family O-antigen flippase, partial [Escherichia coli O105]|nr:O105 family O-antigen flippase [Escherichia coli O105]
MSIFNNLKWNTFSQVFKILTQLISIVYLARIIPPNEYGIMAMAGVVMNFASLFRDLGTSAAIIQKEQLQDETKSAVFWLNFLLGFLVFIIIITLTPFISHLYNQPKLLIVLPLLSFSFIISGSSSLHLAMLERESKFFIISKIEVFSAALSLLLAIILANNSFGIYSLVFQSLLNSLSSAVLLWIVSPWRPKGKPRHVINHLKEIFRFTSQLSLFNIINFFARNLD